MSDETNDKVARGEGWSCANLTDLGEGPGFRKIRGPLGVTAFGVNAIVLPPAYATGSHLHEKQEELYFVHSGGSRSSSATAAPRSSRPAASPGSTPPPPAASATSVTRRRRCT